MGKYHKVPTCVSLSAAAADLDSLPSRGSAAARLYPPQGVAVEVELEVTGGSPSVAAELAERDSVAVRGAEAVEVEGGGGGGGGNKQYWPTFRCRNYPHRRARAICGRPRVNERRSLK